MDEDFASRTPEEKTKRCFVAVPLPEEVRRQASEIQRSLRRKSSLKGIRWTRNEGLHITLKFMGGVPVEDIVYIAQQLSIVAQGCWPTRIRLDRLGVFPNLRRPRVLWWGTDTAPSEFLAIHFHVQEALHLLGYEKEDRPFHPHVTLGRLKGGINPVHLAEVTKDPGAPMDTEFSVERFDLMESRLHPEGAIHESLAEIHIEPKQPEERST